MKHFTQILGIAFLMLIAAAMPAVAQNGSQNKAIITTAEGEQQLNTDEISVIRFDGGKVTVEQPWGNTTYDGTLRSLSFQRPNPGTLRLTANAGIGADYGTGNVRRLGANAITGEGKLKTTWESGDKVYVYADESSESSIGELTPKTFGSNSAQLTGDINAAGLSGGQTLYFSTMPRPINLSAQDGTVESLFYCTATATVTIDGGNASIENLAFARPVAIVRFTLIDKADGTTPLSATKLTVNDGTANYTVTPASATSEIYVAIPGFSDKTVTLSATVGSDTYTYEKSGVTFTDGKYYSITVKMKKEDYTDLGLSVKWAKMNVGATTEGDYGQFFAWGETTGYSSADTSDGHNFGWASYKWCNGSYTTLTKYNSNEGYGTIDGKATLESADDAATAIMGSPWRMPTEAEWTELIATKTNTAEYTWEWTTANGHNGYRITRKSTGANIFLPAAGCREGTSLNYQGSYGIYNGCYWSSSLYESNARYARYFNFSSSIANVDYYYRYNGCSVRAVQDAE